jgi:peptidylprolyl isomerase
VVVERRGRVVRDASLPSSRMRRRRPLVLACLLLSLLVVVGCGGDDKKQAATATATPGKGEVDLTQIGTDLSKKPVVALTAGDPPGALVKRDIVKGKGKAAKAGETVKVQYVGVSWTSGRQFDASWDRGQPLSFPLGGGRVIKGWDTGVVGMKVGGRRLLIIPPNLGYGAQSPGAGIAPNDTLVFVVDLTQVA